MLLCEKVGALPEDRCRKKNHTHPRVDSGGQAGSLLSSYIARALAMELLAGNRLLTNLQSATLILINLRGEASKLYAATLAVRDRTP